MSSFTIAEPLDALWRFIFEKFCVNGSAPAVGEDRGSCEDGGATCDAVCYIS